MECKDCQYLIKHYGFCAIVNDWVTKPETDLSFQLKGSEKTSKTMDETYGDESDHKCCPKCGMCIDCGDCKCDTSNKSTAQNNTNLTKNDDLHVKQTAQYVKDSESVVNK